MLFDNNTSEAECLDDSLDAREDLWDIQEMIFGHSARSLLNGGMNELLKKSHALDVKNFIDKLKTAYKKAKEAKVGTKILCATCGKEIIKKSHAHVFCRSKGSGNCKDKYWNSTDETRLKRAKIYKKKMKGK